MKTIWMIRAGSQGLYLDVFESGQVAIGYDVAEDLSKTRSLDDVKAAYLKANPGSSKIETAVAAGVIEKFLRVIKEDDPVVTYDPGQRVYWIGRIAGPYQFQSTGDTPVPHRRKVVWENRHVSRDDLPAKTKYSLGTLLTITQLNEQVWSDLQAAATGKITDPQDGVAPSETIAEVELEKAKRTLQEQARERLKDRIVQFDDSDMQELMAAVLRGMGFRTTVSPTGPDRGVDVLASPDGLGLQEPRIKAEVKHRKRTQMGAPEIRSFIGGLRQGDKGLYLSTGGFTKEARYEAERSPVPVKLLDLEDLARLIETHYESFDNEGRSLIPLTRIYWAND